MKKILSISITSKIELSLKIISEEKTGVLQYNFEYY